MSSSFVLGRPPRILLGVCGGIAAYKALELARLFAKQGAELQTVLTAGAEQFVTPLSFQALTGRAPRGALLDAAHEAAMGHIELARWPDAVVIAPATAHCLAQMAAGLAGDLLTTLLLATDRPVWVAPAMNPHMWTHAATQANAAKLAERGVRFIAPASGLMACGDIGQGRLAEVDLICAQVMASLQPAPAAPSSPMRGLKAVVTAGPTREPIDPVRFITNRSSGKQGFAVAEALAAVGAEVTVIAGPTASRLGSGIRRVDVETAQQMLDASLTAAEDADLLVSAAAVADYRMQTVAAQKMKKSGDELTLHLVKNPDILATLRARYPQLFLVGFAAETERLAEHARSKLTRKGLDLIAANWVGEGKAFDTEDNALSVFWPEGEREIAQAPKAAVARALVALIAERLASRPRPPLPAASPA
ncbi:MAG: bifunctional phosphopantothenoylcysteine decarboxylase/phosphopantothenate--cysteine ligase CoaBC [Stagnimonas sp.]|nr:bifunctional phosphopantothenoylcysteine decarboxylase/phosphopantothenate--cysteine ligase CoaBC [Stagnimonas sp.]